jgi:hypothetical protein
MGLDRSSKRKFMLKDSRFNLDAAMYRAMVLMWLLFMATAIYEIVKGVL